MAGVRQGGQGLGRSAGRLPTAGAGGPGRLTLTSTFLTYLHGRGERDGEHEAGPSCKFGLHWRTCGRTGDELHLALGVT